MAESYIGKSPQYGYFNKQILSAPINASVTLDRAAADTRQLIVVVGGVIQEPETSYSINAAGTTLTFTETPDTSSTGWIIWLGQLTTSPRVMPGSITAQTALGTSPAAADVFLMYDDSASVLKKVAYSDLESDTAAMGANTVKVRDANSSGVPSNKTVADTQLLIGDGTGFTAAALSGDVTMTNAGVVTIANTSVENAMLADNAVTGAKIAMTSDAQGDVLFYGGTDYERLAAGTSGYFLKTLGSGADPAWAEVPAGAPTGGGTEKVFYENENSVDSDYTLTTNYNAVSAGPVTVASGVTVTIPAGQAWVIV